MTTRVFVQGLRGRMGQAVSGLISEDDARFALAHRVEDADVVVDFSSPQGALDALRACVAEKVPLVTGTTALENDWQAARDVAAASIAILEAPNMSLGVNLVYRLLDIAASSIGDEADIDIIETHHTAKVDAPSGTALRMGEVIREALSEASDAPRYHSLRAGDIPGEHRVKFTLAGEQVEICHFALNRSIFARGALHAAEWIRTASLGVYSMQDVLDG